MIDIVTELSQSQLSADWVLLRRARNPTKPLQNQTQSGERYWDNQLLNQLSQFVSAEIKTSTKSILSQSRRRKIQMSQKLANLGGKYR